MSKVIYNVRQESYRLELVKHDSGDFTLTVRDAESQTGSLIGFRNFDNLIEVLDDMTTALFEEEGIERPQEEGEGEEEDTVNHPKHYTQHPSGLEAIDIIEHLTANLANAVKYIWRAGLKSTTTAKRDLAAALWYTRREQQRLRYFDLDYQDQPTDIVWRAHARRVIDADPDSTLAGYLQALLDYDWNSKVEELQAAIAAAQEAKP